MDWNKVVADTPAEFVAAEHSQIVTDSLVRLIVVPLSSLPAMWTGIGMACRFLEIDGAGSPTVALRLIAAGAALLEKHTPDMPKESRADLALRAVASGSAINDLMANPPEA